MSTWIFLRGLTRESRHWGRFPADFAASLGLASTDAQIVLLDLPGNGRLRHQRSPAAIGELVEYCRAEMLRRALPPPLCVLAMSLGGMVAVSWAQKYPDEIGGCVLINTSMRPFSPWYWRLRPANYWRLVRMLWTSHPAQQEDLVLRMTSRNAAAAAAVRGDWIAMREEFPVSRANALRQIIAAAGFRADRSKPRPRMLVLASRHDRLVDARCSRALAGIWEVDLAEHPSAGHDLPLDDGAWVAQQVSEWLARPGLAK